MYVDTSLGKYLALLALLAVLGGAVAFTFTLKDMRFGATPFYSAITLLWQEATGHIAYPLRHALLSAGLRERPPASGEAKAIPALAYHRLVDQPDGHNVTVDTFREHMEALYAGGWQTVTLGELAAFLHDGKALPERSVLITFDDGAKQSFYPTDPILRSLGFSAVNYIIAKAPFQPESTYYLSDAEIARMLASGRWEIGSHSYDGHRPYAVDAGGAEGNFFADLLWNAEAGRLESQQEFVTRVDADLRRSRAGLEDAFGIPIDTFAFPFGETGLYVAGNFSDGVRLSETAAASVYSLAWLQAARSEFTYNYPDPEGFLARRIKVEPSWSGKDLVDALNDGLPKALPYGDMLVDDRGWRAT